MAFALIGGATADDGVGGTGRTVVGVGVLGHSGAATFSATSLVVGDVGCNNEGGVRCDDGTGCDEGGVRCDDGTGCDEGGVRCDDGTGCNEGGVRCDDGTGCDEGA